MSESIEDTTPTLQLIGLAESLADHFTERGLLSKEIKVAEIIEVPGDMEAWDASEEYIHGSVGKKADRQEGRKEGSMPLAVAWQ